MKNRVILTLLLLGTVLLSFGTHFNEKAMQIHDESFERSITTFAVAKGLNAVISLIQGTELNATPAGVGVTLTIGEILDPMNDLIERFSWVMLAASVSLGVQKLLLSVGGLLFVQISLALLLVAGIAVLWYKPLQNSLGINIVLRLGVVLLVLRFGAIVFINSQALIYGALMQHDYAVASQTLSDTQVRLEGVADRHNREIAKEQSIIGSLTQTYDKAKKLLDIKRLELLYDKLQKQVISLITIFVVLTVLLPLLFFWIFFTLIKWASTGRLETTPLRHWLFGYST